MTTMRAAVDAARNELTPSGLDPRFNGFRKTPEQLAQAQTAGINYYISQAFIPYNLDSNNKLYIHPSIWHDLSNELGTILYSYIMQFEFSSSEEVLSKSEASQDLPVFWTEIMYALVDADMVYLNTRESVLLGLPEYAALYEEISMLQNKIAAEVYNQQLAHAKMLYEQRINLPKDQLISELRRIAEQTSEKYFSIIWSAIDGARKTDNIDALVETMRSNLEQINLGSEEAEVTERSQVTEPMLANESFPLPPMPAVASTYPATPAFLPMGAWVQTEPPKLDLIPEAAAITQPDPQETIEAAKAVLSRNAAMDAPNPQINLSRALSEIRTELKPEQLGLVRSVYRTLEIAGISVEDNAKIARIVAKLVVEIDNSYLSYAAIDKETRTSMLDTMIKDEFLVLATQEGLSPSQIPVVKGIITPQFINHLTTKAA